MTAATLAAGLAWLPTAAAAAPPAPLAPTGPAVLKREPRWAIGNGRNHTVAVRADGVVETWWENEHGQLGRGTIDPVNVERGPLPLPGITGAVAAAAGPGFSFVILADGSVLAWGENGEGQLGIGAPGYLPKPGTAMPPVPTPTRIAGLTGVRQIAAGERFALAVLGDGTVMAWGDGNLGALGDGKGAGSGSHYAVPFPRPVPGVAHAKQVAAGFAFGLALLEDGTVMGWGANEYGQMGDDAVDFKATPRLLPGLSKVTAISAGGQTAFALLADGTVVGWGRNTDAEILGPGSRKTAKTSKPVPVRGLRGVVQLATDDGSGFAVLADGTARSWGDSTYGVLGAPTAADGFAKPPLTKVAAVAPRGARTYWLLEDEQVMVAGFRMADMTWRKPVRFLSLAAGGEPRCVAPAAGGGVGKWREDKDRVLNDLLASLAKADREMIFAFADRARDMSQGAFPRALTVEAEGARFVEEEQGFDSPPLAFGYEGEYLGTVCDEATGRPATVGGTGTGFLVGANARAPLFEEFQKLEVGGRERTVYKLARGLGELAGLPLFDPWGAAERVVLVAPGGRLPYKPLTRRQYLEALRRYWQAQGGEAAAAMDDVEREFAANIEQVKRELTGEMRDKVVAEMERGLAQIRAQRAGNTQKLDAGVAEELSYVDDYLAKHDARDLARPAVMSSFGFRGEFHDDDPEGRTLVVLDERLGSGKSRGEVRFVVVTWEWSEGNPRDDLWREEFERTFPFAKLPALLGR